MGAILTPDQRLRVYISAAGQGLEEECAAARHAVERLRLIPVNKEEGARPHSTADVIRSYLGQSQIFVGIYGSSYGQVEPGEETSDVEYEFDLSEGRPRLLYLKNVSERDNRLDALLDRVRSGAHSYKRFDTSEELQGLISDDLALLLTESFSASSTPTIPIEDRSLAIPEPVLPVQMTSMVGRERDVEEIEALLRREDVRLLTLTGPGGIGKSRLAFEVLARAKRSFADGIQFALLAPLHDPKLVPAAIGQALAVREAPDRSTLEVVKELLRDRELLLLLDNFEHLLESATVVSELLLAAPRLKVLATSRAALQLLGEREYVVRPLSVPRDSHMTAAHLTAYGAVSLFVNRASVANRAFELTEANADDVVEIVSQLDGLPLAIELAAARSRSLSPQLLLERLQSRFDVLSRGPRDLPERQQTLRALLDWDYELLKDDERMAFRRLSVFVRGFTLDAAQQVALHERDELESLELVESLLRKSLLRQDEAVQGEPRFAMINTLREYAVEKLEEAHETDDIRRAHALFYAELAEKASERLRGQDQMRWLDALEAERDNMRAALRWSDEVHDVETELRLAAALSTFWEMRGYLTEGQRWLERALANSSDTDDPLLRVRCLDGAGILSRAQGELKRARSLLEEAVRLRDQLRDPVGRATSLRHLGNVMFDIGDLAATKHLYEEALEASRQVGDEAGMAAILNNLGVLTVFDEDWDRAETLYDESHALYRKRGDQQGVARTLMNLGDVKVEQGDFATALTYLHDSFVLFQELRSRWDIAYLLEGMANMMRAQAKYEDAAKLFGSAESLREQLGAPLPPSETPPYQRLVEKVRSHLDPDAFADAWEKGRAMDMDEAVAFALSLA